MNLPPQYYITPGKQVTQIKVPPLITYPKYIGVPQTSSRYAWGPWIKSASNTGKAEAVFDSSLVPESFGSVARMNQVGQDAAGAGGQWTRKKAEGLSLRKYHHLI